MVQFVFFAVVVAVEKLAEFGGQECAFWWGKCVYGRERQRQTDRQRQTETDRQRQTDRETETQRDTERERIAVWWTKVHYFEKHTTVWFKQNFIHSS